MIEGARQTASLALLVLSAAASLASARLRLSPWVGLALAPLLLLRLRAISARPRRALPRLLGALLAATLSFGLVWALYPVLSGGLVRVLPLILGGTLLALAVLFFMGRALWDPDRTVLPASVGALAVAAYNPDAVITGPLGVATLAVFLYLVRPSARLARLLAFAVPAAALALGILRALPWAQPKVEAAAASILDSGMAGSGLNLDSTTRLGDVQRLALSRTVVLRVFTPRPQKLRARVFTRFDGARWSGPGAASSRDLAETPAVPAGLRAWLEALPGRSLATPGEPIPDSALTTKVLRLAPTDRALPSPLGAVLVRVAAAGVRIDAEGLLTPSKGSRVEIYGLLNVPRRVAEEPGPETLDVPPDTDPRLRELAARLAEGARPEQRVLRTTAHLGRECRYSLEPGRFRSKQPVAEFLFEKKLGYCEYFASAAALLLRLEGVPTRYVTGFNVPGAELAGDHYVVRDSDAHAWIEAWLPGRGFVEADPTPPDQYAAVHAPQRGGFAAWEWLRARWGELSARWRAGDPALARWLFRRIGVPLVLVGLGLGAWRLIRRRRRPRRAVPGPIGEALPPDLARLLARLDRHWLQAGAPRPASRAPLEHLESLPPVKSGGEASRRVVAALYEARFAGAVLSTSQLEALGRALDEGGIR